jgi:serine/threonine protein kinase
MKPENIMLDDGFNLKLADFGFSSSKAQNETRKGTDSYMSPEIHLGHKYSGQCADLFAAGIILFIMVAQHPPFTQATPKDPHYKTISANRLDLFWKLHSRNKPGGLEFFSEDFRDLITELLSFDPIHRPSLAEIKSHPWCTGPVPTYDEIKTEFATRKAKLDEENMQDEEEIPEINVDPSVFIKNTVHRGIGGDVLKSTVATIERNENEYVPEFKRYTQFFSDAKLDKLFDALALFADQVTTEFEFAPESYSATLNLLKDDYKVVMTVNILKVEGEDKHCIEVVKNSGDRFVFNDIYQTMKKFFGGLVNATEPK